MKKVLCLLLLSALFSCSKTTDSDKVKVVSIPSGETFVSYEEATSCLTTKDNNGNYTVYHCRKNGSTKPVVRIVYW